MKHRHKTLKVKKKCFPENILLIIRIRQAVNVLIADRNDQEGKNALNIFFFFGGGGGGGVM